MNKNMLYFIKKIFAKLGFETIISTFFFFMYLLGIVVAYIEGALCIRLFFELFFELYLLSFLIYLCPHRVQSYLKNICCIVAYSLAIIDVVSYKLTGASITPLTLQLVLQTNVNEASDAINSYFSLDVLETIFPILLVLFTHIITVYLCKTHQVIHGIEKWKIGWHNLYNSLCFLLLFTCLYSSYTNLNGMFSFMVADSFHFQHILPDAVNNKLTIGFYQPIYRFAYSLKAIIVKRSNIKNIEESLNGIANNANEVDSCTYLSPNIILVIGESYNRHHSQLYGYNKNTTPFQLQRQKAGELIAFRDVITSWNYTSNSFEMMMSLFGYGDRGEWYHYSTFPMLFKKAGYWVAFFSNQFVLNSDSEDWDFGDIFINNKNISEAMFDYRNDKVYDNDGDLIMMVNSLVYPTENKLLIYHLIGQHLSYDKRFTSDFSLFSPKDYNERNDLSGEQKQILSDYDNATLYNDYVIETILKQYENTNTVILYVPDHGEMVFDKCQIYGRTTKITANTVYQQYEIPFWIWGSQIYRDKHKKLWDRIEEVSNNRFMTDNLPQLLLYLAGIYCPEYKSNNNILSEDYNENRPRLITGQIDYDKLMYGYN